MPKTMFDSQVDGGIGFVNTSLVFGISAPHAICGEYV